MSGAREQVARLLALVPYIQARQEVPLEPDYCGFTIPNVFVVGYGLDFDDDYRHLPFVGVLRDGISPSGECRVPRLTTRHSALST